MRSYERLALALMLAILVLIPMGASISLHEGASAKIGGQDSVAGVYTQNNAQILATGGIQAAVNAAKPGATIFLWPKKYYENVHVPISLTIQGSGALWTIVDGQQKDSVFEIGSNPNAVVTLSGMTIQNGKAPNGGGINNDGTLTVKDCKISRNTADYGGGIWNDGTLTVKDSTISGNIANFNGGGIYNGGNTATVSVSACKIIENTAKNWGGGIGNYNGGKIRVEDSWIGNNKAGSYGGGIDTYVSTTATVKRCIFTGNLVENGYGGGIEVETGSTLTADLNVFKGNDATWGGGISNHGNSKTTITGSMFSSNLATSGGGAIYSTKDSTLVQASNAFITPTDTILDPKETNPR
jgi:predicted outer membrane repeat protein